MVSKDLTPVRFGERWLDDGARIELWLEDGSAGLTLEVVPRTRPDTRVIAMLARRVDDPGPGGRAIAIYDPAAEEELQVAADEAGVFAAPVDVGWLRLRLDPELRAGLAHRAERQVRAEDPYDWKEGDTPRAMPGSRVAFADVFPCAWDIVTAYRGRRYALVDHYVLDRCADERPFEIEVVDLAGAASVGVVEVEPGRRLKANARARRGRRARRPWRSRSWRHFARMRRGTTWSTGPRRSRAWRGCWRPGSDDLRDPSAPIFELLRVLDDPDPDLVDRVIALGMRGAPVLHGVLADPGRDRAAIRTAARLRPAGSWVICQRSK